MACPASSPLPWENESSTAISRRPGYQQKSNSCQSWADHVYSQLKTDLQIKVFKQPSFMLTKKCPNNKKTQQQCTGTFVK